MSAVFLALERFGNYYPMEIQSIYAFESRKSAEVFTDSKPAGEGYHWEIVEKGLL